MQKDAQEDDPGPVRYMERTRTWYAALGYGAPYRWPQFEAVPFHPLPAPLDACRVALVTTAAPFRPEAGNQGPGAPYNAAAKFWEVLSFGTETDPDLRISHVAIDRDHTTAEDPGTWLPLSRMREAAAAGRIRLGPRVHCLPTNRSQRTTLETDVPELLRRVREDGAEAAILVPNCPVCHLSAALAARALEAEGITTLVMGCARDIVEHAGVPRFLFSDFPLGNAAGRPGDRASQAFTLDLALRLLEAAPAARTSVQSPLRWSGAPDWRRDYCNIARLTEAEIAARRAAFDAGKAVARQGRAGSGPGA